LKYSIYVLKFHVLLAAMVFGFGKVAGLEQSEFRDQWAVRIRYARAVRASSKYSEFWTQSDPEILWNKQVEDLAGLTKYFQAYRWHGLVTIFLFWTGWESSEKQAVLEYLGINSNIRYVCIADECRRPQGHRQTFQFMMKAGFTMYRQRSGLSMSCSSGMENFTLVCWQRSK